LEFLLQVLVEDGFAAKVAILNRPKKLNAVNELSMKAW
jgi:hypothetical protein